MLKQRVLTALVAVVVLLTVLFALPPAAGHVFIMLLMTAAAWEWSQFLGSERVPRRMVFLALVVAGQLALYFGAVVPGLKITVLYAAIAWWAAAAVWTFRFPTPVPQAVVWLGGLLVLLPTYVALSTLLTLSPWFLLALLLVVWLADIGAYFSGRSLGRVKLAPAISPGKTWEGVLGGLAAALTAVVVASILLGINLLVALPLGIAVVLISVIGDLTVSMFKRAAGVKDSGRLFPGHGGILDRVDSVCAAAPVFVVGIALTGMAL